MDDVFILPGIGSDDGVEGEGVLGCCVAIWRGCVEL